MTGGKAGNSLPIVNSFHGWESEIGTLLNIIQSQDTTHANVTWCQVVGRPGMGKSRLAAEIKYRLTPKNAYPFWEIIDDPTSSLSVVTESFDRLEFILKSSEEYYLKKSKCSILETTKAIGKDEAISKSVGIVAGHIPIIGPILGPDLATTAISWWRKYRENKKEFSERTQRFDVKSVLRRISPWLHSDKSLKTLVVVLDEQPLDVNDIAQLSVLFKEFLSATIGVVVLDLRCLEGQSIALQQEITVRHKLIRLAKFDGAEGMLREALPGASDNEIYELVKALHDKPLDVENFIAKVVTYPKKFFCDGNLNGTLLPSALKEAVRIRDNFEEVLRDEFNELEPTQQTFLRAFSQFGGHLPRCINGGLDELDDQVLDLFNRPLSWLQWDDRLQQLKFVSKTFRKVAGEAEASNGSTTLCDAWTKMLVGLTKESLSELSPHELEGIGALIRAKLVWHGLAISGIANVAQLICETYLRLGMISKAAETGRTCVSALHEGTQQHQTLVECGKIITFLEEAGKFAKIEAKLREAGFWKSIDPLTAPVVLVCIAAQNQSGFYPGKKILDKAIFRREGITPLTKIELQLNQVQLALIYCRADIADDELERVTTRLEAMEESPKARILRLRAHKLQAVSLLKRDSPNERLVKNFFTAIDKLDGRNDRERMLLVDLLQDAANLSRRFGQSRRNVAELNGRQPKSYLSKALLVGQRYYHSNGNYKAWLAYGTAYLAFFEAHREEDPNKSKVISSLFDYAATTEMPSTTHYLSLRFRLALTGLANQIVAVPHAISEISECLLALGEQKNNSWGVVSSEFCKALKEVSKRGMPTRLKNEGAESDLGDTDRDTLRRLAELLNRHIERMSNNGFTTKIRSAATYREYMDWASVEEMAADSRVYERNFELALRHIKRANNIIETAGELFQEEAATQSEYERRIVIASKLSSMAAIVGDIANGRSVLNRAIPEEANAEMFGQLARAAEQLEDYPLALKLRTKEMERVESLQPENLVINVAQYIKLCFLANEPMKAIDTYDRHVGIIDAVRTNWSYFIRYCILPVVSENPGYWKDRPAVMRLIEFAVRGSDKKTLQNLMRFYTQRILSENPDWMTMVFPIDALVRKTSRTFNFLVVMMITRKRTGMFVELASKLTQSDDIDIEGKEIIRRVLLAAIKKAQQLEPRVTSAEDSIARNRAASLFWGSVPDAYEYLANWISTNPQMTMTANEVITAIENASEILSFLLEHEETEEVVAQIPWDKFLSAYCRQIDWFEKNFGFKMSHKQREKLRERREEVLGAKCRLLRVDNVMASA